MMMRTPLALVLLATAALGAARQEMSLNGKWELSVAPAGEAQAAPPRQADVPGYVNSAAREERLRFSRQFTVPEAMKGQRLAIRFGGVKYRSTVLVNGTKVGGCFGGYQPFEVDVTDAARPGQANTLVVEATNWTGIFSPGPKAFLDAGGWDRLRNAPRDRILAPIGGLFSLCGIWDDVVLRSRPAVHVKALFIKPSVRRKQLVVECTVANEGGADAEVELSAVVEEGGRDILRLPKARLRVPAGGTATATVQTSWPKPHLWTHADPHLYHLRTQLDTGDLVRTRFGFREFWVDGPDFVLNGSKMHLLASSGWPPHAPKTREEMADFYRRLKACGCVAFRTHTQPWRADWYDVADEVGILIVVEGAIWNDDTAYRVDDPVFWDNYAKHLEAMVRRDRNHPSVVMWSLENEFTGQRMNDNTPGPKAQLIRMGRLVKQWDPTRPITYESDGDPGGVADVIGLHYPHEYPQFTRWPNEAYWLDKPSHGHGGGGFFLNGEPHFLWKKRKPLYIGEFLWLPSSSPAWHTVFFGDDAYIAYRRYRNMGKAESWKMQILGYRHFGVSGICPWTVVEGGKLDTRNFLYQAHQYAYQPVAAYCHDYDRCFYGGEKVSRRVEVFNDVLEPSKLELTWDLSMASKIGGGERFTLGPGEQRLLDVVIPMPQVDRQQQTDWTLRLFRDGKKVFEEARRYTVFPKPRLPKVSAKVGLYDPKGATRKLFEAGGLSATPVESIGKLGGGIDVLVVGSDVFEAGERAAPVIGRIAPERQALLDFTARGGRILVLEQRAYPEGLFDLGLSDHSSTMTFPLWRSHPALRGVEPEALKFWRGDHSVTRAEPPRPATGAAIPIVVSGSSGGIDHAPLLERPIGSGCIVFSQLQLVEKFASEPIAARILGNLLDYLATYRAVTRKAGVIGGSKAYHDRLRSLGLRFDDLTDTLAALPASKLPGYFVIVCRGAVGDRELEALRRYVDLGGRLVLHRWPRDAFARLSGTFAFDFDLKPYDGPVTRAETAEPQSAVVARAEADVSLFEAIAREDLYWLGEHRGIGWAETPRATAMADAVVAPSLDPAQAVAHEIERWELDGQIVERRGNGVVFATVGSASADVEFPETGTYVFGLVGSGTPCDGTFPLARIAVDGIPVGSVYVAGAQPATYTTFGRVEKGRRRVSVAFVNDASNPPREDRNLHADKLLIAFQRKSPDLVFLTRPAAVALVRRGKGIILVDQLRWDTEERNARKAARYATSLLTVLGGDFTPRPGVAVECETLAPKEGMAWYRKHATHAYMGSNGFIGGPIRVAQAGRYTVEIVAGGTACEGEFPHVDVAIDGRKVGEAQLTGGGFRGYCIPVDLPEGTHQLTLSLTNDRFVPGKGDVNLRLDKVVFYKE